MTVFTSKLNLAVFKQKDIPTFDDKVKIVKTLGLWVSIFLFGLTSIVMTLRIVTGKSSPAEKNDPPLISTLNRIITNTIEQTVIFAGLYAVLLFGDKTTGVSGRQILALASFFVIGRVTYAIGYLLGTITGISTFRSFGFAIAVFINTILVCHHFGINSFSFLETHGTPIIKSILK